MWSDEVFQDLLARSNFYVLEFLHYVVLVGEHRLDGEGNRRCGMVRYGMSDELGASYGWCWDTAVLCTRVFELGPLLLSWVKSASFIFAIMDC